MIAFSGMGAGTEPAKVTIAAARLNAMKRFVPRRARPAPVTRAEVIGEPNDYGYSGTNESRR